MGQSSPLAGAVGLTSASVRGLDYTLGHTPLEVQVCCWKGQVIPEHSKSCEKLNNKDPPSELIDGQWHAF